MKRRDLYNHMDRNHTGLNGNYQNPHRTNIVNPEFLLGQLWIQEQESNGVKIIELDSNSSNNDLQDENKQTLHSHAWSYINQEQFRIPPSPRGLEVNYKAREKHRQNKPWYKQEIASPGNEENAECRVKDFFYPNYQDPANAANEDYNFHQNANCFTNMTSYPKTSDSSTDVEYIDRDDLKAEMVWNAAKEKNYDEILTYDSNLDADKRTIYIYSFKNKHLFTENDGTNISNGSSSSTDAAEEQLDDKSNGRVPSPIPDAYVPKLNLLKRPNLPTVTEITEPKSSQEIFKTKMPNGWFQNNYSRNQITECSSANLIDWMSLSPREKRRRSTFCENCRHQAKLQVVRETSPIAEDAQIAKNIVKSNSPFLGDTTKIDYLNLQTDKRTQFFNDSKEKCIVSEDRGDHLHNKSLQKLKIEINPKTSNEPIKITEPIEKLDSNNWIGNETIVTREKSTHKFLDIDAIEKASTVEGDVSRRLWDNNMVLLQPSEWSAFYPVNSVPSLHLSLETEIEEVPWFKRIIRCLKCFK
ncbi:uncharacterized protein LOC128675827 [Plodia interpunctella]|uniref:uncharacterized protein LOC128675827 n=1 Tax=Plodia interpunctella TaxID=58824 RepID=UPI0023675761|nr:uncharacterized protein LOC128675827 [Plodia interpunctella]